uniref:Solute carrier family 51, beta subunit n=1 Tax=Jaculus jaculus TaxID=51337 RepID=A0A8C5KSN4_JACJA
MENRGEPAGAPADTGVSQELLEEMIWFFRVEDAAPWNYSILALAAVVVVISMFLLVRSIQANRNRKKQPQEKEKPEVLYLDDAGTKENNSLNHLTETLIPEKPTLAPAETELNEKATASVCLGDLQEPESQ